VPTEPAALPCPFCRRHPADRRWRPFCSERCKLQDLARWADGAYRIPGARVEDTEHVEPNPEDD
jgi:endogenous inhibitor of DNA gyrase (YacG/DUF329 family)